MSAALHGLVLAGGHSTRMKRDKATLTYLGTPQLPKAYSMLSGYVARCFVSVRPDQADDGVRNAFPQILDSVAVAGPLAGIMSAQSVEPAAAWMVLACDLPFLDDATLAHLVEHRDPARLATAYRSTHNGLPEPLCAIYEPASREVLQAYAGSGRTCPRKFLQTHDVALLEQPTPRALENVNSNEDYWAARAGLLPENENKSVQVTIQYFAILRDQAARSDEALRTDARTPRELYEQLQQRYGFTLPADMLRVAVNTEFGDWAQPLADGDAVVFIPPVAGG